MKSQKSKVLNLILAIAMMITVFMPIMANAASSRVLRPTDVVITKVGLESLEGWPKGGGADTYTGAQITDMTGYFQAHTLMEGVAFRVYQGSDASAVDPANEVPGGPFLTDANGQVRVLNLQAGSYYFVEDKAESTYVGPNGEVLNDSAAVPFTLKLPMVKADGSYFGTGDDALYVYPKNTDEKPEIDKNFADVGAQYPNYQAPKDTRDYTVGDSVPYEVKTLIPAKSAYKTLVWTDVMTEGLTYNKDLVLTATAGNYVSGTDYNLEQTTSGFKLEFTEAGLAKLAEEAKVADVEFTLKYTATLNDSAVVEVTETNNIVLQYGNSPKVGNTPIPVKPDNGEITVTKSWDNGIWAPGENVVIDLYNANTGEVVDTVTLDINNPSHTFTGLDPETEYKVVEKSINGYSPEYTSTAEGQLAIKNLKDNNPEPLVPTTPKVVTYGEKFLKQDAATKKPLAGAEFVVKNSNGEFLKLKDTTAQTDEIQAYKDAEAAYQAAIKAVVDGSAITPEQQAAIDSTKQARDAAYEAMNTQWAWTPTESEAFVLTSGHDGLFEITGLKAGSYSLKEIKAPEGYALLTSDIPFTVGPTSYSDTEIITIDNNKVTIPQTGGIGSIIFVVIGIAIMGATLVIKKRRNANQM